MFRNTFWGNVKQVISQLSIYATPITLILSAITAWKIQIYPYLSEFGYDFHLWEFLLILGIILLVAAFVEWKYSVPSFFRAWTKSFYTKDNPLRQDIQEIKKRLEQIEKANASNRSDTDNNGSRLIL